MEGKFLRSTCLVVGLIALYGCGKREASNNKATGRENVLKFPITTNIQTLDPSRCVDQPSHQLIKQIFEGLVYIDGKNNPQPALASSWEISKDKKTYTFHLNKRVSSG
jgi:oligopeptide transport system substrate-binding protein